MLGEKHVANPDYTIEVFKSHFIMICFWQGLRPSLPLLYSLDGEPAEPSPAIGMTHEQLAEYVFIMSGPTPHGGKHECNEVSWRHPHASLV